MIIKSINQNVCSEWRLIVPALQVKVGRVTQSVNAGVCPAGDRQRHRVERLQLSDSLLYTGLKLDEYFMAFI